MPDKIAELFLTHSANKLKQMNVVIQTCLERLQFEQIWERGGSNENAVGNLVLHLSGNLDQYVGSVIAGEPDTRNRPAEFIERNESRADLLTKLGSSVTAAVATLEQLPESRLEAKVVANGGESSVLELIYQVVGHFQQHTGQIISATKRLTGEDLRIHRPSRP